MSRENVERLHAFLEPWGREPWTPEAWERGEVIDMSLLDPNVVYEDENLPDHIGEAYRGHEGIRRAARRWVEPPRNCHLGEPSSARLSNASSRHVRRKHPRRRILPTFARSGSA